jgi:hypothetical protein
MGSSKPVAKKSSFDSLRAIAQSVPKREVNRSSTSVSKESRESTATGEKKRFGLVRKGHGEDKQQSDDLTKMIARASNYMTFSYIRMQSVVLCLSYKGKEQRNFEDVHNFVFRMPVIEWQNKTWSNMDLAMAFKKACIRALLSHTGAIIGNKFSKHRPNAEQRNKLRDHASSSVLIAPSSLAGSQNYAGSMNESDDSSSLYAHSPVDFSRSPPRSLRGSTHGSIPVPSRSSSVASSRSRRSAQALPGGVPVPTFMNLTPPTPIEGRSDGNQGLGIDFFRPGSSSGFGHRGPRRVSTGGSDRPVTSHSSVDARRRSGGGIGLRDKISAFTHRMSHRESSGGTLGEEEENNEESASYTNSSGTNGENKPSPTKRMTWAPGRTRPG